MKYDSFKHHRQSIRLKDYDYSSPGAYFVTICAKDRGKIFGKIDDGEMHLNQWGEIVRKCWFGLPNHFANVELDEFIVMPNHVHGIIIITFDENDCRGLINQTPTAYGNNWILMRNPRQTLGKMIRNFKAKSSKMINEIREMPGFPIWQRNFYDHIIRDEDEINQIRQYIRTNPQNWDIDTENPNFGET